MNRLEFLGEKHYEIYLEVDRLYHACVTEDGRCIAIADYILRLLNEQQDALAASADAPVAATLSEAAQ